jgi:hypothetical protein
MSTIAAGTTSGTALVSTGDTTGALVLQTNGTTTAVTIATNQVVTLAQPLPVASGGTNLSAGTSGGVLAYTASGTLASSAALTQYGVVYGGGAGAVPVATAAGTTGQVLTATTGAAPTWATVSAGFTLGTPVATTSGTSIDFTGIPSGVKQIVVLYRGVSTSGTSQFIVQIGDSGGVETTGYSCQAMKFQDTPTITSTGSYSGGWIFNQGAAATANSGSLVLTLENATAFASCGTGMLHDNNLTMTISAGSKALSATLDRVRITTYNGSDTFDAGEINIAYI